LRYDHVVALKLAARLVEEKASKRLMHIDTQTLDETGRFRRKSMALSFPFPKGDMTMDLDLATFLTALYVMVDDLSQSPIHPMRPASGGPPAERSDSEVLCLGLASQWRSGVPWQSERGVIRYVHKHLGHFFPLLLSQSALNRRLRRLWGAFLVLQDAVAKTRVTAQDQEVMDGFPIPVAHGARSFPPGWFAAIARIGQGGTDRYCYGVCMRLVISRRGGATGGALASGNVPERGVAELLLSTRAGQPRLPGPLHPETHQPKVTLPTAWRSPAPRGGLRLAPAHEDRQRVSRRGLARPLGGSLRRPGLSQAPAGFTCRVPAVKCSTPRRRNALVPLDRKLWTQVSRRPHKLGVTDPGGGKGGSL
jgi:hypothetical protein